MTDQNRKTLRSFYCRDYLWELFEQMTHELGCSMDYLINESMRMYARSREFPAEGGPGPQGAFNPAGPTPMVGPGANNAFGQQPRPPQGPQQQAPSDRFGYGGGPADHRTFDRMPSVGPTPQPQPPRPPTAPMPQAQPQAPMGGYGMQPPMPPQPQPPMPPQPQPPMSPRAGGLPPQPPQQPMGLAAGPPPPPPRPSGNWPAAGGPPQAPGFGQPPSPTGGFGAVGAAPAGRAPLYLTFNNNKYLIDKDKFIIGRGSQQTDLTIRDGNISRKHCCVIWHNGAYYIKDLESTNGIEFQGNRIESKKIDEGDIFYLCDYELRFSYRS